MKVEIQTAKEQKDISKFPFLGILKDEFQSRKCDLIVLFTDSKRGSVVYTKNTDWILGEYCDDWDIGQFEKFQEKLAMSNEE